MLSRVADNLYWMSRYLERAEHTARLLDVNLHGVLDQTPQSATYRWERLLTSLHTDLPSNVHRDAPTITHSLTLDARNPTSILSCVIEARDNARQAWEQISSEMWEQINRLFLYVNEKSMDDWWLGEPHTFFTAIKDGARLFQGVTDSTISHGEGWHFIRVGRGIERASATASLIGAHFTHDVSADSEPLQYLEWTGLLKSCSAFEAYVKLHTANVEPESIVAFLLLNAEFPRSIRFEAAGIRSGLQAIARAAGGRGSGRPERLAGRLQAALEFSQIDEIMADDLHAYLAFIEQQCNQIHTALHQTFVRYPVAAALSSSS